MQPPATILPDRMPASRGSLATILVLFVTLRLTVLFFFSPQGLWNNYTDFQFYYNTAALSEHGRLPFVNMWYEYPPLLAYIPQAAYMITNMLAPDASPDFHFAVFLRVLGSILLAFDAGCLVLMHRMGRMAWGVQRADYIAWAYSGLALPLAMLPYAHQIVAAFFLLFAVERFMAGRYNISALALGLGIAAKLTPVFFLAPAVRFLWPDRKGILRYVTLVICAAVVVYLPFLFLGGAPWIAASFRALASASSYGTVGALLDNNWSPGYYGPLETRLSLALAGMRYGNPPVLPGILVLLFFASLYAIVLFRTLRSKEPAQLLWFTTLSLLIFQLWSKGWSPQYALMLLPFLLLAVPDGRGVAAALLLTVLSTTHWLDWRPFNAFLMASRTMVLIFFAAVLSGWLWPLQRTEEETVGQANMPALSAPIQQTGAHDDSIHE